MFSPLYNVLEVNPVRREKKCKKIATVSEEKRSVRRKILNKETREENGSEKRKRRQNKR